MVALVAAYTTLTDDLTQRLRSAGPVPGLEVAVIGKAEC